MSLSIETSLSVWLMITFLDNTNGLHEPDFSSPGPARPTWLQSQTNPERKKNSGGTIFFSDFGADRLGLRRAARNTGRLVRRHIYALPYFLLGDVSDFMALLDNSFPFKCTVVQRKNETPLFISIQIIIQKWNWYQSSWISVYFRLML